MSTAVKRACDACHRRKVKCDGINPCRNCSSAQLTCTYNAIPQKKGPKGSRAKVISELRETQRQTSLSAKVQSRLNGINSPPHSPTLTPTPGLLAADIIKACVDYFFEHLYPTAPVLSRQRLEQQVMYMDQNNNRDTYCLVAAFCAYVMIQPGMRIPGADQFGLDSLAGANIVSTQLLIDEAIRVRKSFDYTMSPTFNTILTSYFLFAANECMTYHEKAWFHLREAATLMWMVGMNKEEVYGQFDGVEASRRRRLYWLVFVSERAFGLQNGRPLTLQATINPPTVSDDPTDMLAPRLNEFVMLVNLFRSFDDAFTLQWNKTRGDVTQSYLLALQKQFNEARSRLMNFSEQHSEGTNQQWLKNMTWQLNFQNGSLNSNDQEANMAFQYGMDLSREVMSMQSQFTTSNMEMVGIGMMTRLFEVALSTMELLALKPASRNPLVTGVREHGAKIHEIITILRNGDHRFLALLMSKVHEVLPKLCNPLLQEVPECLAQNLAEIDIFDGFGSLGMAQPPQPMMKMEDYDHKFVPGINTDTPSSHGLPTTTGDISSPFSPAIMSPSLEIGPGLRDFNSMPDMVMSPVGHAPPSMMPQNSMNPQQTQQQALTPPQMQQQQQQQTINPHQMSLSPPQQMQSMSQQSNMGMPGLSPQQMQSQGMPGMSQNIMPGQMPIRPQPHPQQHRSNSFAIQAGMTVADFQALQRVKTEPQTMTIGQMGMPQPGIGMAGQLPLPNEIDFSTLR